ncbi:hypothetical protein AMECASPLE_030708 [Ameca splendens]|uniref:Uncharacterized protein n=1 Tax=Ameca splendens TaxID=208324 RepID=A0ABV1A2I0_9TELE
MVLELTEFKSPVISSGSSSSWELPGSLTIQISLKQTLSTLQPTLTQVPPTCAPHHHSHSSNSPGSALLRIYLRVTSPWKDLPPQNSSCVALSDPAALIPLAVHLPPPLVIYRSRISNPYHSPENKTFKLSFYLLSVILHVGQINNKNYDKTRKCLV